MCTIEVTYTDGKTIRCLNVKSVSYARPGIKDAVIQEDALFTERLPVDTPLLIVAEAHSYSVSGDGIRSIKVGKE